MYAQRRKDASQRGRRWHVLAMAAFLVGGLTMTILVSGCGGASGESTVTTAVAAVGAPNTITVVGKATVSGAPDEAVLILTVETDGTEPGASLSANATAVNKVLERLQAEGVAKENIETANVSVYPTRTYNPETGEETLTGYRSQNTVTVTITDAQQVGKVLSAAVDAGANIVAGPVWKLKDDTAKVAEALKQAVANARTKAEALASAQGVKVGDVIMMNETGIDQPVYPMYASFESDAAKMAGGVIEAPVMPASLDVTATVTVTYVLSR